MSRFPIVVVTPPSSVTNEQLDAFFVAWDREVYARKQRFMTVLDLRRCQGMPATQRRKITDRMQHSEHRAKVFCAGSALVFESALLRSLLTAILWVRQPASPLKVFSSVDEAVQWGTRMLEQSQVA